MENENKEKILNVLNDLLKKWQIERSVTEVAYYYKKNNNTTTIEKFNKLFKSTFDDVKFTKAEVEDIRMRTLEILKKDYSINILIR